MRIAVGENTYEWIDDWAKIPDTESARNGFAHHSVVVTEAGTVMTFHQGDPTVLELDRDGNLLRQWDSGLSNAHDIALVKEEDTEYLWLANNESGDVVKKTLDGQTVMSLRQPDLPVYREGRYSPTSVAVNEERCGGNGEVWVADGYGESYVHRFSKAGDYLGSINGEEGEAGRFTQPHGIWVDRRKPEPELYVADRRNARVQVYDLAGGFKRSFGSEYMIAPSCFITHGDLMMIVEHRGARVTVLDVDDNLVGYISRDLHAAGKFNSPHGMAADADGNLYVVEWLIGGRTIKLAKV